MNQVGLRDFVGDDGGGFCEEGFAAVRGKSMLDEVDKTGQVRWWCGGGVGAGRTYWPLNFWNRSLSWFGVERRIRRSMRREQDWLFASLSSLPSASL